MIRSVPHGLRRVRQTLTGFDNGPQILGAYMRARVTGRPEEVVFRTHGVAITCPNVPGARVPVYEVQVEDTYRLSWITTGLPDDAVVVDIGAHIGSFSLALTTLLPHARVAAFEPAPATYTYLTRNLHANDRAHVTAHQVAVAAHTGTIDFTDNGAGSVLNGITNPDGTTTQVHAITMTNALDLATEGSGRVDLLKFDAEGAEYDTLLGTPTEVLARIRRAVVEHHDVPGHSWPQLRDHLATAGLRVIDHEPVTDRLGTVWLAQDL